MFATMTIDERVDRFEESLFLIRDKLQEFIEVNDQLILALERMNNALEESNRKIKEYQSP